MAGESNENPLEPDYTPEVERDKCARKRTIDKGAVYDHVYVEKTGT